MDNVFESFLSLHTVAFIIGCYALTWLTRRFIETSSPSLKPVKKNGGESYKNERSRWWNSFILYLIPPGWGLALGYFLYPYLTWPSGFSSLRAVMFFGMVCGWLSGLVYKFLVKLLLRKLGATDEKEIEKEVEKPVEEDRKTDSLET